MEEQSKSVPLVTPRNKSRVVVSDRQKLLFGVGTVLSLGVLLWLVSDAISVGWTDHKDDTGYNISYPKRWQFDEGQDEQSPDIITGERGAIMVNINHAEIGPLSDGQTISDLVFSIEDLYYTLSFQSIDQFDLKIENQDRATYVTSGTFTDTEGTQWHFEERGVVLSSGSVDLARVSVLTDQAARNQATVDRILDSFEA